MKLQKFNEAVDPIAVYLTTFERLMELNCVDKELWTFELAPQMTGMQGDVCSYGLRKSWIYDWLKAAILRRCNNNEVTYRYVRIKFRRA